MARLKSGIIITSPVSGQRYQVAEMLGEGGFGCAYRAHRLNKRDHRIEGFCLKTTTDAKSWHHEAYFGELLKKSDRAIRMYESFPFFPNPRGMKCLSAWSPNLWNPARSTIIWNQHGGPGRRTRRTGNHRSLGAALSTPRRRGLAPRYHAEECLPLQSTAQARGFWHRQACARGTRGNRLGLRSRFCVDPDGSGIATLRPPLGRCLPDGSIVRDAAQG